jgi:hypothetical protein
MKRRVIRSGIVIAALLLAGSAWAQVQAPSVDVGFPFVAAGKTLKAGSYAVDIAPNGSVVLAPEQGGPAFEVADARKLHDRTIKRPELVFDVVGSARFLSEVRVPGKGAYLVGRRGDAQEQETVSGPKVTK